MSNPVDSPTGGPQPDPSKTAGSSAADKSAAAKAAADKAREAALKASQEAKRLAGHAWKESLPFRQWIWLNLRVWLPFLATPDFRERKVSYGGRENRDGTKWNVNLPKQCWQCSKKDGLRSREYESDSRSFEAPVGILVCTVGLAIFALLIGLWLYYPLALFSFAILLGGCVLMYVKSWPERVRLVQWTCNEHADAMRQPEIVVYENELHLILATHELADAAGAELAAKRRAGGQHAEPRADSTVDPMARVEASPPPKPQGYKRDELPPIKLD
jgi:hypothetical protein